MSTKRIYQTDQYAAANEAVVTAVREKNGLDVIACDTSVFYPEGGGQPSDTGSVSLTGSDKFFRITRAFDESLVGDVWHITDAPAGTFSTGDRVRLSIDRDLRFRNMQRHCGEHMLSGTMDTLFGGVNKGFHMGDEYITIDIDLGGRMLTDEELDEPNKGMNRIYFDCGKAAFDRLSADSRILAEAARRYSCSPADFLGRLDAEAESISALKARLAEMTSYIKDKEKERILRSADSAGASGYVYSSDVLNADDLLKLGFSVINEIPGLFLIMRQPESHTCLLLSSSEERKCGAIVKAHVKGFNGKGGGRDDNARAIFPSNADMDAFIKEISSQN